VEIPAAGHLANLEAPEAFNQALAQFLQPLLDCWGLGRPPAREAPF
jgi:hypothetical protein